MRARAISFDFDNTLLLSEACKHATMREVCAKYPSGLDVLATVPSDSRTAPVGVTVTRHTIFAGVASGLLSRGVAPPDGVPPEGFGIHLCSEFSTLLEQRLLVADEVPGATALLSHLSAHGVPCFVNTATPQEPIDELVDALKWRPYFRRVLGAPGTKVSNLASAVAAAGLASPVHELVHVGDGDNDCKAAGEFGCRFVGVALDPTLGGSGAVGGGFTKSCVAVVADMHAAAPILCGMLGIPPLTPGASSSPGSYVALSAAASPPTRLIKCRCVCDLGFVLSEGSISWPTCKALSRNVHKAADTSQPPGARNKQSFTLNGGSGTHLDAPSHFIVGGRTVDELLPSELAGVPLAVVDVCPPRRAAKRARDDDASSAGAGSNGGGTTDALADMMVGVDAILTDEARYGRIPDGALVVIRTGWAAERYHRGASAYYNVSDPNDIDGYLNLPRMHFPGVAPDAARLLVRERRAVGIGIDTLSPDGGGGGGAGFPTHHAILGADRYVLENLHLAEGLPARGATAFVAPLNVQGAPEAPARVWAVVP